MCCSLHRSYLAVSDLVAVPRVAPAVQFFEIKSQWFLSLHVFCAEMWLKVGRHLRQRSCAAHPKGTPAFSRLRRVKYWSLLLLSLYAVAPKRRETLCRPEQLLRVFKLLKTMKTIGVIKEEVRDPTVSVDALRAQLCILAALCTLWKLQAYEFAGFLPSGFAKHGNVC